MTNEEKISSNISNENPIRNKISNKYIFLFLFLGAFNHLIFDTMMYQWEGLGIYWFFPLRSPEFIFSFGLFWPGVIYPAIIVSIIVGIIAVVELIIRGYHYIRH